MVQLSAPVYSLVVEVHGSIVEAVLFQTDGIHSHASFRIRRKEYHLKKLHLGFIIMLQRPLENHTFVGMERAQFSKVVSQQWQVS